MNARTQFTTSARSVRLYALAVNAFAAFLLAFAIGACDLVTGPEPLKSAVDFTLTDGYDLNGTAQGIPALYLSVETERQYPCMNYQLAVNLARSGSVTTLELVGVRTSSMCLTAPGPATFRAQVDPPPGRSTLVIKGMGGQDTYTVAVSDSMIEVSPAAGTISHNAMPRSWRVPRNTFAAQCNRVTATVANPAARCAAFHDSLAALPGVSPFVFGSAAAPPSPPFGWDSTYGEQRAYRYTTEATLADAEALIRRLARNDSSFYLSFRTWRNESRASWWPQ